MYTKISKLRFKWIRHVVSLPFIFGLVIPMVILDFFVEIYHHVAFPLYGLPLVRRSSYIRIDHQKLSYLSTLNKIGCVYCGYSNGFAAYLVRIAGVTERYWCGIRHQESNGFIPQQHQKYFLPYGDEQAYRDFVSQK